MKIALMIVLGVLSYFAIGVVHYWLYNFLWYKCSKSSEKVDFSHWYKNSDKEFLGVVSCIWWLTDVVTPFGLIIVGVVVAINKLFRKILKVD